MLLMMICGRNTIIVLMQSLSKQSSLMNLALFGLQNTTFQFIFLGEPAESWHIMGRMFKCVFPQSFNEIILVFGCKVSNV
jgi:hypothetical protein